MTTSPHTQTHKDPGSVTPKELYEGIGTGSVPYILDVRNQEEFALWQVEGPSPVPMKTCQSGLRLKRLKA